jgi:acyl-CoA thioesterase FadM
MYPVIRIIKEIITSKTRPALPPLGTHVSHHRCWPQDLDTYLEMNNGRILTILDIGRTGLGIRTGLVRALRQSGWGLTMAGASVRYRKRIRPFAKFRTVSTCVGWDDKFMYLDQSIWIKDTCAAQALYRAAVTDKSGIIHPDRLLAAMGQTGPAPLLPDWVQNWIDADRNRPWPPSQGGNDTA